MAHPGTPSTVSRERRHRASVRGIAVAMCALACGMASAQRVLVVTTSDAPAPFAQALAGVAKGSGGLPIETQQIGADNAESAVQAIGRAGRDTAIVALGTHASEVVARTATAVPVVSCMVLSADVVRALPNAVAVPIEIPVDAQIAWLRKLLPAAQSIGLLFDPAQNARRIETIASALTRAGYSPLLVPVVSTAALPAAIERLTDVVDAMLAIPDTTVYTPPAAKALLLFSFRHKIPLIGLTEAWVKAGALYALEWDYQELGSYCGALAARALAGPKAPVPPPPRPRVVVNLRIADQFRLKWNAELVQSVDARFE